MAYCCNSGTKVMRGSSIPQISSGYSSGFAGSVGVVSTRHPSIPFAERAAHKCDSPRRSSTRHSSNVSPSASLTAPALNTLLIGYGQSRLLRIGLPSYRVNNWISASISGVSGVLVASSECDGAMIGFSLRHSFQDSVFLRWRSRFVSFRGET
jgi:hypothetical protein